PFVCNTPSPTEVATPITEEITANESTVCLRLGRIPNTDSSAVEMRPFFFFLNCKKPITSATITKRDYLLIPQWKKEYPIASLAATSDCCSIPANRVVKK